MLVSLFVEQYNLLFNHPSSMDDHAEGCAAFTAEYLTLKI
jgi:hypothetical protein